jgi:hypothetical protein
MWNTVCTISNQPYAAGTDAGRLHVVHVCPIYYQPYGARPVVVGCMGNTEYPISNVPYITALLFPGPEGIKSHTVELRQFPRLSIYFHDLLGKCIGALLF